MTFLRQRFDELLDIGDTLSAKNVSQTKCIICHIYNDTDSSCVEFHKACCDWSTSSPLNVLVFVGGKRLLGIVISLLVAFCSLLQDRKNLVFKV